MFIKFKWIDTEIDNFCDLSDFILSKTLCNKSKKKNEKLSKIYVNQVYSMFKICII